MPYHRACEVTSYDRTDGVKDLDEHGGKSSPYVTEEIRCKIPEEDLCPWGMQLYAFLGIFYLPVFIDMLWFDMWSMRWKMWDDSSSPFEIVQLVKSSAEEPRDPGGPRHEPRPPLSTTDKVCLPILTIVFVPALVFLACMSAVYAVMYPAWFLLYILSSAASPGKPRLSFFSPMGANAFSDGRFVSIRKTTSTSGTDNGEEVWEMKVTLSSLGREGYFPDGLYWSSKLKVAFGPIAYWCVFRKAASPGTNASGGAQS